MNDQYYGKQIQVAINYMLQYKSGYGYVNYFWSHDFVNNKP